jgi:hypothetical protein
MAGDTSDPKAHYGRSYLVASVEESGHEIVTGGVCAYNIYDKAMNSTRYARGCGFGASGWNRTSDPELRRRTIPFIAVSEIRDRALSPRNHAHSLPGSPPGIDDRHGTKRALKSSMLE